MAARFAAPTSASALVTSALWESVIGGGLTKTPKPCTILRKGDRKEQLKRQAERRNRFRLRDLEHKALGVPVKVTVDHRGIRREIRGHCAGGGLPAFGSLRDSRVLNLGF